MKRFMYVSCFLYLIAGISFAPKAQVYSSKNVVRIETARFEKEADPNSFIYVPMGFNEADTRRRFEEIDINRIMSISLVYTQYRASERFNQLKLNNERTHKLFELLPEIRSRSDINWYWIAQTGCQSPGECYSYFHGFEIRLKSVDEQKNEKKESELLKYYTSSYESGETSSEYLDSLIETGESTLVKHCDTFYHEKILSKSRLGRLKVKKSKYKKRFARKVKHRIDFTDDEITLYVNSKRKIEDVEGVADKDIVKLKHLLSKYYIISPSKYHGKRVNTTFGIKLNRDLKMVDVFAKPYDEFWEPFDSFYSKVEYVQVVKCNYEDTSYRLHHITGSYVYQVDDVVTEVLDRNKHWKNCIIATDVTGSMSPYLGQFLAWHKLNLMHSNNTEFIFFNDGNNMRDKFKRVGKVGGVYYTKTNDYKMLEQRLHRAQTAGGGGDAPENNMEAVLYGIKKNPRISGIIMIADNYATPRDLRLLKKVKKPIHVILCGSGSGVNIHYLNMIRKNGGTLHTIEEDLTRLSKMSEGEQIEVAGQVFIIQGGKFVQKSGTVRW